MTQYTLTEVAALMNINTNTLIQEVDDYENNYNFDIAIVTNMVIPIGTVSINNKQYYFGYECKKYYKNKNMFFNHIVLSEHCSNTKWNMNNSTNEEQVVMAMRIDESFYKRYGQHIIW